MYLFEDAADGDGTKALDLMQTAKIKPKHLITQVFPLESAMEAFETQFNSEEAIKILIKVS